MYKIFLECCVEVSMFNFFKWSWTRTPLEISFPLTRMYRISFCRKTVVKARYFRSGEQAFRTEKTPASL